MAQTHTRKAIRKRTPGWWLKQAQTPKDEMPTEDEMGVFKQGEDAYRRGSGQTANPFSKEAKNNFFDLWTFGWEKAQVEHRKRGKNRCKVCGFEISTDSDLCGECVCEI